MKFSWNAPITDIQGHPLPQDAADTVDHYWVHLGQEPGHYTIKRRVECAKPTCTFEELGLEKGTWYVAIQSVTRSGVPSEFSAELKGTAK